MVKKTHLFLLLFIIISSIARGDDASVGNVISYSGDVRIDSFGNGSFIEVVEGEYLYKNSVIKTGDDGRATITVMEVTKEIPSSSELSIEKIISLETRKKESDWFRSLMELIQEASNSLFTDEEDVDLASRGDLFINHERDLFTYETEEDLNPDYSSELIMLLDIPAGNVSGYLPGELELKKGFCYFGLGNYEDALRHFIDSKHIIEKDIKKRGTPPYFHDTLDLMLGLSHYYLAEYPDAIPLFRRLLEENGIPALTPYISWFLLDALYVSGRLEEAKTLPESVKTSIKDCRLEDKFLAYLEDVKKNGE
ncbi:MAG: tetratricopeptide repeat protein [Spirochaetales bacterium]|nr:tetratricopeptide repeat protein [Spirochaetales bacterium]